LPATTDLISLLSKLPILWINIIYSMKSIFTSLTLFTTLGLLLVGDAAHLRSAGRWSHALTARKPINNLPVLAMEIETHDSPALAIGIDRRAIGRHDDAAPAIGIDHHAPDALPAKVVDTPTESSSAPTETPAHNTITTHVKTTTFAKIVARQYEPASAEPLDLPAYGSTEYGGGPPPEALASECAAQMGGGHGC
jgi:hypothetical protein